MRNDSNGIFMIFLFIMLAAFTKVNLFFFIALFFFVRMMMGANKKSKQKNQKHYDRRTSRQERRGERRRSDSPRQYSQKPAYKKRDNPFKKSGIRKYKEFELEDAIIDFNKGLEIEEKDIALHFNIACAYSLTEQKEKAFHHLKKAVQYGFKDYEKIQSHDDLAFIRIQPEYEHFRKSGFTSTNESGEKEQKQVAAGEPEVKDDVLLSQLNKLAELRKKGLLSEQEFAYERKKLLNR